MSFQSDLIGVLKADIGPSASLFFKKCMHQLKKDPSSITPSDREEIAEWIYKEIRSMLDEETASRVRYKIVQIPTNALVQKLPSASLKTHQDIPAFIENPRIPDPLKLHNSVAVPAQNANTGPAPEISSLFGTKGPVLQEKNNTATVPVPVAGIIQVSHVKTAPPIIPVKDIAGVPLSEEITMPDMSELSESAERPALETADQSDREDAGDGGLSPENYGPADQRGVTPVTLAGMLNDCLSRLKIEGENPEIWIQIADLSMRSGKFREATQAYEKVVEFGVETPTIWISLGDSYKKTGRYEESDIAYARSLELEPNDPLVWLKRAKVLVNRDKYEDALASCNQALTLDESSSAAWHYMAFVLKKAGRYEEALEIYTHLNNNDPKDENTARQITTLQRLLKK
jgi:hypothetical protein